MKQIFIENIIQSIWYKKNIFYRIISLILIPFSFIYVLIFYLRKIFITPTKFDIPIICVGNCNVGGAGKTSTFLSLIKIYKNQGLEIVVFLKGYKGKIKSTTEVSIEKHSAYDVGDEALLYAEKTKTFIGNNRIESIKKIISKYNPDFLILDDGFQDFKIKKDKNILVVNKDISFGNRLLLPAGPLREFPSSSINRSNIIIEIGENNDNSLTNTYPDLVYDKLVNANISTSKNLSDNEYLAFSGIGNNNSFFNTLKQSSYKCVITKSFPDHYYYTEKDIKSILDLAKQKKLIPITTKKDIKRLSEKQKVGIEFLEMNITFEDEVKLKKLLF